MRVSELIEKLKEVDQDTIVICETAEGELFTGNLDIRLKDVHVQPNGYVVECTGIHCYACERNSESPQNYKKVKGLRIS